MKIHKSLIFNFLKTNKMKNTKLILCLFIASLTLASCSDEVDNPKPVNETEVISDVTLTFTNTDGEATTYTYTDPKYRNNDYLEPTITLQSGKTYDVAANFYDKSDPDKVVDKTTEIIEEKDDHFVEFRFSGANIALTRTDGDETTDSNGIKIGLFSKWTAGNPAEGTVQETLIHQPESKDTSNPNGNHTGGETDAQVTYDLVIQ